MYSICWLDGLIYYRSLNGDLLLYIFKFQPYIYHQIIGIVFTSEELIKCSLIIHMWKLKSDYIYVSNFFIYDILFTYLYTIHICIALQFLGNDCKIVLLFYLLLVSFTKKFLICRLFWIMGFNLTTPQLSLTENGIQKTNWSGSSYNQRWKLNKRCCLLLNIPLYSLDYLFIPSFYFQY